MHAELIDELGGVTKVARALGIARLAVVGNWRARGVPWKYRQAIATLAAASHVDLPRDFLPPAPVNPPEAA